MNAKSLPLLVAKELKEIAEYIERAVAARAKVFDITSVDAFGFKVTYIGFSNLFFEISGYQADDLFEEIQFSIIQIPNNGYTSIEKSTLAPRLYKKNAVLTKFNDWLALVQEFEKLAPIDFTKLFSSEKLDDPLLNDSPDTFTEQGKTLGYCLKSLRVSNFQGIKNVKVEDIPVDCNWIFLVGENGFGKSTVLQSILLGLHGSKDGAYDYAIDSKSVIQVRYKSDEQNMINDHKANPFSLRHLAAYGPSRLNMQVDASMSEAAQKSGTLYSLFRTDGVLLNIESELVKWKLKNDNRFNLAKRAFLKLVPYLADIQLNPLNDRIEYIEKDTIDDGSQYEPLPFEKIASGFRSILGIAGDMIIRLSNTQKDVENPSDLKGIVIIDELDLHWHPKLQKQIPELFSEVFPNIQFIVSTHSPIPLLGAPKNSVIFKVNRTKEEGITVQKVEIDLKTLTPNLLLTSGVFDMDDIFSIQLEDLTDVRTEDTFEEMEKNDGIDQYLENFEKSNQQFPDELFEPKSK